MGIYQELYNLIEQYIYGNPEVMTEHMDLVCTFIATAGSLFVVALPFLLVWRVIRMIAG